MDSISERTMTSTRTSNLLPHISLISIQIFFSILPAFSKIAFRYFPPESIAFARIVFAAILFYTIFWFFRREAVKDKKDYLYFALFAFFGVTGNQYFYLLGVHKSTAINASILISTIPVFTLIVAVVLKKETFSPIKFIGVLIAMAGVLNLLGIRNFNLTGHLAGNLLIILNSLLYSIYLVISKPFLEKYKPFTLVTYVFVFAAMEISILTIPELIKIDYASIPASGYFPVIILIVFGTFLPYLIVNFALKNTNSSVVAIYTYVQPVIGSLLAIVLVGETLSLNLLFSAIIIFFGLSLVILTKFYKKLFRK